jgi:hypothetical protein
MKSYEVLGKKRIMKPYSNKNKHIRYTYDADDVEGNIVMRDRWEE